MDMPSKDERAEGTDDNRPYEKSRNILRKVATSPKMQQNGLDQVMKKFINQKIFLNYGHPTYHGRSSDQDKSD